MPRFHGCSGQQVILIAIAVEVDPANVRAERRRAGVGKVESHLEPPGQPRHARQISDLREIKVGRAPVLKPIVEIESGASAGCGIARVCVRAQKFDSRAKSVSPHAAASPYTLRVPKLRAR